MDVKRRDFLKNTGLFTAAGLLPGTFSMLTAANDRDSTLCDLAGSGSFFIRNASVITMDEDLGEIENASVLVENGEIREISRNISAPAGVEIINGEGAIVMPGLIDCHRHLWTSLLRSMSGDREEEGYFPMTARYSRHYTEADMKIAARYAGAEAINAGITTVSDFNHNARNPDFIMASCDALAEAGMRAEVLYGGYRDQPDSEPTHFDGIRKVQENLQQNDKYNLLFLGLGSRGVNYEYLESDWERARELGLRITIHASSTEDQIGQIQQLADQNMLKSDVNIIHGNAITNREIEAVKNAGASISMTPYSEMRIGYGFPKPVELCSAGVNVALGVDTVALSGDADLFSIMKLIQNIANAEVRSEFYMKPNDVLKMATINGARTLGLDQITGSLTPGKRADLIMLKKNDLNFSLGKRTKHLVVEASQPQNVDFVSVDGNILKRNGRLTQMNATEIIEEAEKSLQRLYKEVRS